MHSHPPSPAFRAATPDPCSTEYNENMMPGAGGLERTSAQVRALPQPAGGACWAAWQPQGLGGLLDGVRHTGLCFARGGRKICNAWPPHHTAPAGAAAVLQAAQQNPHGTLHAVVAPQSARGRARARGPHQRCLDLCACLYVSLRAQSCTKLANVCALPLCGGAGRSSSAAALHLLCYHQYSSGSSGVRCALSLGFAAPLLNTTVEGGGWTMLIRLRCNKPQHKQACSKGGGDSAVTTPASHSSRGGTRISPHHQT